MSRVKKKLTLFAKVETETIFSNNSNEVLKMIFIKIIKKKHIYQLIHVMFIYYLL